MLRSITIAIALLILATPLADAAASYCGRVSELSAARQRWATTRQSCIDPAKTETICRAYGIQFYEAVEARQAASL